MITPENTNSNEKEAIKLLSNKYGFKEEELQTILKNNIQLPVSIIKNDILAPLEAIVKYLRENKNLTYKQIGKLLSRDPKTLAVTYSVARKKQPTKIILEEDTIYIEFSIFNTHQKQDLSILETICYSLKNSGMHYNQISRILGKSQKTIWTVYDRATKKIANKTKIKDRMEDNE
ncbi:MAG: hypothetical protein ACP5NV_01290 [Candidatus Woesearchaeota archaeon]